MCTGGHKFARGRAIKERGLRIKSSVALPLGVFYALPHYLRNLLEPSVAHRLRTTDIF